MENNSICILGSSGFIGKYLVNYFSQANEVSLRNPNWRQKLLDQGNGIIINLIGKAHDHKGKATKEDYYDANVELTKKTFNCFLESSANVYIHISSIAAVEEFHSESEILETSVCNPVSLYGKSKLEAEKWLLSQQLPKHKKLFILRPPMVHGEGDKGNLGLFYKFIVKGIPYPLYKFNNKRSFIYIENFSYLMKQIIKNFRKIDSGIYNLSDDQPLSTNEILTIISDVTGRKIKKIGLPIFIIKFLAKIGDVINLPFNSKRLLKLTGNLVVSNEKIKQALNISKLEISSEVGMQRTIESFQIVEI